MIVLSPEPLNIIKTVPIYRGAIYSGLIVKGFAMDLFTF